LIKDLQDEIGRMVQEIVVWNWLPIFQGIEEDQINAIRIKGTNSNNLFWGLLNKKQRNLI
jgi:hypothetical protein